MIDTLRYANRLKDAGVPAGQAEVMAQALGDTLSENVATRADLDRAVADVKGDIARLDAKFEARFEAMDAKFEALSRRVEARSRRASATAAGGGPPRVSSPRPASWRPSASPSRSAPLALM